MGGAQKHGQRGAAGGRLPRRDNRAGMALAPEGEKSWLGRRSIPAAVLALVGLVSLVAALASFLTTPVGSRASQSNQDLGAANQQLHVYYQFYEGDVSNVVDYVSFSTPLTQAGDVLEAGVNPASYDLAVEGAHFRITKNFAGGEPADEHDVTAAHYDQTSGVVSVPLEEDGSYLAAVFQLPYDHPARSLTREQSVARQAMSLMASSSDSITLGTTTYSVGQQIPINCFSSDNNPNHDGTVSPLILGTEPGFSDEAWDLMGVSSHRGKYGFPVAFSTENSPLFSDAGALPGLEGGKGSYTTTEGSSIEVDFTGRRFVWADCVENVYNSYGYVVAESGYLRIDAISDSSIHCYFFLACHMSTGKNAQNVAGYFDLAIPRGSLTLTKSSGRTELSRDNPCYSLEGAEYGVYTDAACTQPVGTLQTNAEGQTNPLTNLIPGTYYVRETTAARGYALDAETHAINIEAGQTSTVYVSDPPQHNPVRVALAKVDEETGLVDPRGAGTLAGAEFTLRWYAGYFDSEEKLPEHAERSWVLQTDANGIAELSDAAKLSGDDFFRAEDGSPTLPLGTVTIRESRPPAGYLLRTDTLSIQQLVGSGATTQELDSFVAVEAGEQAIRGDVKMTKVSGRSMERLPNVPFRLTSLTTGESHIVVTDENGQFDTSAAWNSHEVATNENDAAVGPDDTVDEAKLNSHAGVWFDGSTSSPSHVRDALGALPYDSYEIRELRCSANEGLELVSLPLIVSRNSITLDMGTVVDTPSPSIATSLERQGSGGHDISADPEVVVVDHVVFAGLTPGQTYTLTGRLVTKEDGEPLLDAESGEPVQTTQTFTPATSVGSAEVKFVFDASELVDSSLVAFEQLELDGELVTLHNNLDNEEQTVRVQAQLTPPETPDAPEAVEEAEQPKAKSLPQMGDGSAWGATLAIGLAGGAAIVEAIRRARS